MTQEEIKKKITENNQKIENLFDPSGFALIKEINELLLENKALRAQCKHEFYDGVCRYCGQQEEN